MAQEAETETTFRTLLGDSARYLTHAAFPQITALHDLVTSYKKKADDEIGELKDEVRRERSSRSSNSADDEDVVNTLELGFEQINQHNVTHGVLLDSMLTENRKTNTLLEKLVLGGGAGAGGGGSGGGGIFGDLAKDEMENKAVQWGSKLLGRLKGFLGEGLTGSGTLGLIGAGLMGGGAAAALNWGNQGELHTPLTRGHENDSPKDLKDYYQAQKLQAGVKEDDSNLAIQREALMKIVQKLDEMDKSGRHNPAVEKRRDEVQKEIDDLSKDKAQKESQIKALQSDNIQQTPQQQIAATRSTGQVALPAGDGGVGDYLGPNGAGQPTFGQTVDAQRNQGAADILERKLGGAHTITQGSGGGSGGGHIGGAGAAIGDKLTKHLMEKYGLTREQATGPVGVMGYESGNFKTLQEIGHSGTGSGYGYAQWTGQRRTAFLEWSKEHKLNPSSYEANEGFMDHELETTHKHVIPHIKKESTARGSAHSWETYFEGMREGGRGVPAFEKHMQRAQEYYEQGMGTPGFKGGGSIGNEDGGDEHEKNIKKGAQALAAADMETLKGMRADDPQSALKLQEFMKANGVTVNPQTQAWCAAYVNANLAKEGIKGAGKNGNSLLAPDFAKWGKGVDPKEVRTGDVMLYKNGHHVGMYTGHSKTDKSGQKYYEMIAGNEKMDGEQRNPNNNRTQWGGVGTTWKTADEVDFRRSTQQEADKEHLDAPHIEKVAYSVGKVISDKIDLDNMKGRNDSGFDGDKRFGQMRNRGHDPRADMHGRFGGSNPMAGDAGMMGRMGIQPTDNQREAAEIKANAARWQHKLVDPKMLGRGMPNSMDNMKGRSDAGYDGSKMDTSVFKSDDADLDSLIQKQDLINYAAQINQTAIAKDTKPAEKPQDAMQKLFTELKSHDKDGAKDTKKEKHDAGPVTPPDERIKKLFTNYGGIGHGPQ